MSKDHRFNKHTNICSCGWVSEPLSQVHWEVQWADHLAKARSQEEQEEQDSLWEIQSRINDMIQEQIKQLTDVVETLTGIVAELSAKKDLN